MALVKDTASRLEAEFALCKRRDLPPASELARRHGVSTGTVLKALRLLAEKGLVRMSRGARPRLTSPDDPTPIPEKLTSSERLFESIRERITSGFLASGVPLPKTAYLAAEYGVSTHTVVAAFRMLVHHGLVHHQGKQFIVGPAESRVHEVPGGTRGDRVVLLVQPKIHAWRGMAESERTARFCLTFSQEAERYGVELLPAIAQENRGPTYYGLLWGREQIMASVVSLGSSYLGALVAASRDELPDLEGLVAALAGQGKPVVWFDRYDELRPANSPSKLVTRCHFSEDGAVSLAISCLSRAGHRVVAVPTPDDSAWRRNRLRLLAQRAAATQPPVRLIGLEPLSSRPDPELADRMACGLAAITGVGMDEARARLGDGLAHMWPAGLWLAPYLCHADHTAVIAANDADAQRIHRWLSLLGVAMPRHLSLLSFDNSLHLQPTPVSSIDFGFGHIGYCAFHALLGDVPLKRDRHGDMPALPRLVSRGSVGPPREGARAAGRATHGIS